MSKIWKWALDPGSENLRVRFGDTGETTLFPAWGVFDEKGRPVALGEAALAAEDRLPPGLRLSRPFSGGMLTEENDAAALLQAIQAPRGRKNTDRALAVVALPETLSGVQRDAWKRLLRRCGSEMTAVSPAEALAAAADKPSGCVVDLGARHTEIVLYDNGSIRYAAVLEEGIADWDALLMDFCRTRHRLRIGRPTAAWLRVRLGCALPRKEIWQSSYTGIDLGEGLPVRHAIDSDIVYKALYEAVEAWCGEVARRIIPRLPENGEEILLTGGGAAFFGLADRLSAVCRYPVYIPDDAACWKLRGICRLAGMTATGTDSPGEPSKETETAEQEEQ